MSILSDCFDKDWCSVIVNEAESTICTQKKAQDDCPVKCNSYLPKEHPCATPGINCKFEKGLIKDSVSKCRKSNIFWSIFFTAE